MPRLSTSATGGFAILDRLLFNQLLIDGAMNETEIDALNRLVGRVLDVVKKTGEQGLVAECMKHVVLCVLEILLGVSISDDPAVPPPTSGKLSRELVQKVEAHQRNFLIALVMATRSKLGTPQADMAVELAYNLFSQERSALSNIPAISRYRLVQRSLAVEFPEAPLDCLAWLARAGILSRTSPDPDSANKAIRPEAIWRIKLFCEFESQRRWTAQSLLAHKCVLDLVNDRRFFDIPFEVMLATQQTVKHTLERHRRYNSGCFGVTESQLIGHSSQDTNQFLENAAHYCPHTSLMVGHRNHWVGAVGAATVLRLSHSTRLPVYAASDDDKMTCSKQASEVLSVHGFSVHPHTLYRRYKQIQDSTLVLANLYRESVNRMNLPDPVMADGAYEGLARTFRAPTIEHTLDASALAEDERSETENFRRAYEFCRERLSRHPIADDMAAVSENAPNDGQVVGRGRRIRLGQAGGRG